jgi:hypothetical protein
MKGFGALGLTLLATRYGLFIDESSDGRYVLCTLPSLSVY